MITRPRKFTAVEFEKAWEEYFTHVDNNPWIRKEPIKSGERLGELIDVPTQRPYSAMGFQSYHGLGQHYIKQLRDSLVGKEDEESLWISAVLEKNLGKCNAQKFEGAAVGAFKENIIARELGLADHSKNQHEHSGSVTLERKIVVRNEDKP